MKNYLLQGDNVKKPFQTVFLCGSVFEDKEDDKRVVLKNKIDEVGTGFDTIILEQNFVFAKNVSGFLSYDDIFMKNLHDIEAMMALLSDKIIIIHESISTAAELGLFASNINITKKMCVLTPHKYCIEEEKLSSFIKLAFLKRNVRFKTIEFFPVTKRHKISMYKKDYHTFFANNQIGKKLEKQVFEFLNSGLVDQVSIRMKKLKSDINTNSLCYYVDKKSKVVKFNLPVHFIEILLLALFSKDDLKTELRKSVTIADLVNAAKDTIKSILMETVQEISTEDFDGYRVSTEICEKQSTTIDFNKAVGYILYLFQARGYIQLPNDKNGLRITVNFQKICSQYSTILSEYRKPKRPSVMGYLEVSREY